VSSPLVFEPIYRTVGLPYSQRRQDGPALFPTHLPTLLKSLESHFAFHNQNGPERAIWGAVSTPTALLPFCLSAARAVLSFCTCLLALHTGGTDHLCWELRSRRPGKVKFFLPQFPHLCSGSASHSICLVASPKD
jgi:hypothetical protein